jgi:hypothetical protein
VKIEEPEGYPEKSGNSGKKTKVDFAKLIIFILVFPPMYYRGLFLPEIIKSSNIFAALIDIGVGFLL